jgi:XRE family transcriptional regulator, aerobic/anaerobic benzoate catabolism transcriptional regulator
MKEVATGADDANADPPLGKQDEALENSDKAFLTRLGRRVRQSRAVRGMSRKVLARESDISERYIAQLESGEGNVSIILLRRVAAATGRPLEELIAEPDDAAGEWASIGALLRGASRAQVERVKALLTGASKPDGSSIADDDRIALIGLRGAGKSTLGAAAARILGWPFVELNKEIERDSGFSIAEVFSIYGQEGYRRFEQASLKQIIDRPGPLILATGGGIVSETATFDRLLSSFFTIWIRAAPAEHMARVRRQGDLRPMAKERAAMEELTTILQSREPLYQRARATLDTSGQTVAQSIERLLRIIAAHAAANRGSALEPTVKAS